MIIEPVTLEGRFVVLRPLTSGDAGALWNAGSDPELWRFTTVKITSLAGMENYVSSALGEQSRGVSLPFATVDRNSGIVVGTTRYLSIAREHRRVEVGSTFLGPGHQRTPLNTEAKFLMFRHAFEVWGCNRVELKTGSLNAKSRAAITRIGATEEGILRQHMINDDGTIRDTVYFSVIASEWPTVRAELERKLSRPWPLPQPAV